MAGAGAAEPLLWVQQLAAEHQLLFQMMAGARELRVECKLPAHYQHQCTGILAVTRRRCVAA